MWRERSRLDPLTWWKRERRKSLKFDRRLWRNRLKRKRKAATSEVLLKSVEEDQDDDKEENDNESTWDDDEEKETQPKKKKQKHLTKSEPANMEKGFEEAESWNLSEQGTL